MSKQLPHLPPWPSLSVSKTDGSCCVTGWHPTYLRLKSAEWLKIILLLVCFIGWIRWFTQKDIAAVPLAVFTFLLMFEKASMLLCLLLFQKNTSVMFTADHITVNGRHYQTDPSISVQFRAYDKYLNESQEQKIRKPRPSGRLSTLDMHKLGYRKVELIYGSNVVPIAVIPDERVAAQFAVMLQEAYSINQTMKPPVAPDHGTDPDDDDDPPLA